ncbi:hypothetical protein ACJRO7_021873 [Eucalyptus globulus]|uniref:Uncharacterized protein n=1 Tax=Eucalyptus globulus TaxID=34317 RepID=A0ABD3KMX1_EUCGL
MKAASSEMNCTRMEQVGVRLRWNGAARGDGSWRSKMEAPRQGIDSAEAEIGGRSSSLGLRWLHEWRSSSWRTKEPTADVRQLLQWDAAVDAWNCSSVECGLSVEQ